MKKHFIISARRIIDLHFNLLALSLATLVLTVGIGCNEKVSPESKAHVAQEHLDKAVSLLEQKKWDSAISELSEAIQIDDKSDATYVKRAKAYYEKNDYGNAIADCTKAIQINANSFEAFNQRGLAYLGTGIDKGRAIKDFTIAINLNPDPDAYEPYIQLCLTYVWYDIDKAIDTIDQAIAKINHRRTKAMLYSVRAKMYSVKGDRTKAMADLQAADRLGINPESVWRAFGWL